LPAAAAFLSAGFPGLAIDIKGCFSDQVRLLAEKRGRSGDIVEFGSGPLAMRVNLLEHMSPLEAHDFFRIIATHEFQGFSRHLDWHLKGVRLAVDCLEILRYCREKYPQIRADIVTVERLLNDLPLAGRLSGFFMQHVYDKGNALHRRFAERIKSEQFHVLSLNDKKLSSSQENTYAEQITWRLTAIRNGLAMFLEAPGVARNFSAPGVGGIDLKRLVYDTNKVVLLRFGIDTGSIGAGLARFMIECYYRMTYKYGLTLKEGRYTFMVADEFQEITDMSPGNRMNDNSFAAKAREFKTIQLVGTSLLPRCATAAETTRL
ncbi:MAG: hypothetical protein FWH34_03705, partial [Desulfovibrionaceae bacterium]|nr:hypothetical protein [Desulfovibrionaceae bacterium]